MKNVYHKKLLKTRVEYQVTPIDFKNYYVSFRGAAWVLGLTEDEVITRLLKLKIEGYESVRDKCVREEKIDYFIFTYLALTINKEIQEEESKNNIIQDTWTEMLKGYTDWHRGVERLLEQYCSSLTITKEYLINASKYRNR